MQIGFLSIGHEDYVGELSEHLAERASQLLSALEVDVVSAGTTEVTPSGAADAARRLAASDIAGVIVFVSTWVEGPVALAAIKEIEHLPFALWTIPMLDWDGRRESTGSLCGAAVVKGALDRTNKRFSFILGLPDPGPGNGKVADELRAFCIAAGARYRLRHARIGLIGYASMGMYPGTFDHVLLRDIIGPEVFHFDTYQLIERARRYSDDECAGDLAQLKKVVKVNAGATPRQLSETVKLYKGLKSLVDEYRLDVVNVKCQYELSKIYGYTQCVPLSWLADAGTVSTCEGDIPLSVTMLILNLLTGQPIYYGDVVDVDSDGLLLSSCGFAPFSLLGGSDSGDPGDLKAEIQPFKHKGFNGLLTSATLKPGKLTFARLVEGRGDYKIILGVADGVATPLRQGMFPAVGVKLGSGDRMDAFIRNLASQHYAVVYGDILRELELLAKMLGIEAIVI
ncbi:MAG: hypothetical protein HPY71_12375 [Firmicutes bacterium]|nr:hypothetical protein [Bacillota bacterium]